MTTSKMIKNTSINIHYSVVYYTPLAMLFSPAIINNDINICFDAFNNPFKNPNLKRTLLKNMTAFQILWLVEVSLFDILGFFLDVFARRPEVTHAADPANNK